ncbi:MAG: helix-turn-helix transcriptional regulator [Tenuifilaceae bacterium]|jgi:DNA-binding Xre family transcriptional regulator|nr:helix-turn-helix transcriptional regulator [Tenuifilaceae bacterium]
MIRYNFNRVFKARGIDKPFSFLKQSGFSDSFASKVKNGNVSRLNLKLIERLCLHLRCTPNDFMEWTPDTDKDIDENHPLNQIRRSDRIIDITRTLNSVPLGQLEEIEKLIKDTIKTAPNKGT